MAYIEALSRDPMNVSTLVQMYVAFKDPLLKGAILEGLSAIMKSPAYSIAFAKNSKAVKAEIYSVLKAAIASKDPGQIAIASGMINNKMFQWQNWFRETDPLKEALEGLKLPEDLEAHQALSGCIAYLEGTIYKPEPVAFNHPISWKTVNEISDTALVAIKTSKGLIRVKLFRKEAPGTVANFVNLINDRFYNGKKFHRVVSSFVVQTGCPRGDGYGSLNYTIRSELAPHIYDQEGYIGMASAGNHTECTQWFINTTSTPHLDGNYTIFGKVVEGMDVVHNLEQGDAITEIILVK
jgi:cyclophilin family peptidyl-prolyl cis-trans isomerase